MSDSNFQRIGSASNAHVGNDFELDARDFFNKRGIELSPCRGVLIGVSRDKKLYKFDLRSEDPAVLVERKSHKWTTGGHVPSAKMTTWNLAMYYFHLAPTHYRRILFILKDCHPTKKETLAAYYIRTYAHLIPDGVEIWEYDFESNIAERVR
jgi:hypothetical protein